MQYHVGILLRLPSSKLAQTSFVTMKDLRVISSQKQKISILGARITRCSVLRYKYGIRFSLVFQHNRQPIGYEEDICSLEEHQYIHGGSREPAVMKTLWFALPAHHVS